MFPTIVVRSKQDLRSPAVEFSLAFLYAFLKALFVAELVYGLADLVRFALRDRHGLTANRAGHGSEGFDHWTREHIHTTTGGW